MSQEGRGCLVADQGVSDKVAQFKIEGRGSGPAVPPFDPRMQLFTEGLERKWDFKLLIMRTYISYKQCIGHNNKIYD